MGLVLASFAVISAYCRRRVSRADRWGEAKIMSYGMLLQALSVLICLFPMPKITMLANGFRGIGWAGNSTPEGTLCLGFTAPLSRRGEAAGYYSGVQNSASIFFPAIAIWLIEAPLGGYSMVFFSAAALAFIGSGLAQVLSRGVVSDTPATPAQSAAPWWRELFNLIERDVLLPSSLHFCLQLTMPAITSFIVLYAGAIGLAGIGSFYVVSGITSLFAPLGKASDKLGRARSLEFVSGGFCLSSNRPQFDRDGFKPARVAHLRDDLCPYRRHRQLDDSGAGDGTRQSTVPRPFHGKLFNRLPAKLRLFVTLAGGAVDLFGFTWMYLIMAGG